MTSRSAMRLVELLDLVAQLPSDVRLVLYREEGVLVAGLVRSCPDGGWPTKGHWSAAGSATGRRSSYSRESGLNTRRPDLYRYDDVTMRSTSFVVGDERGPGLVVSLLRGFLADLQAGDDPSEPGGEILEGDERG